MDGFDVKQLMKWYYELIESGCSMVFFCFEKD